MINIKKKLVIFLIAVIPIIIIYNLKTTTNYTYLSIGDDLSLGHTPFNTYSTSYTDIIYDYLKQNKKNVTLNKTFTKEDLRTKDLIKMIKEPDITQKQTLSNALKTSNLITISIGSEELFSKLRSNYYINKTNYKYANTMIKEIEELLKEIRKLTNTKIYFIGYYNPIKEDSIYIDKLFNYIYTSFKELESIYNIVYIRIDQEFKNNTKYLPNKNNAFPSTLGYNLIANKIIRELTL